MTVRARFGSKIIDLDIEVNEQHGTIRIEDLYFTAENAKLLAMVLKVGVSHLNTYEKYRRGNPNADQ